MLLKAIGIQILFLPYQKLFLQYIHIYCKYVICIAFPRKKVIIIVEGNVCALGFFTIQLKLKLTCDTILMWQTLSIDHKKALVKVFNGIL